MYRVMRISRYEIHVLPTLSSHWAPAPYLSLHSLSISRTEAYSSVTLSRPFPVEMPFGPFPVGYSNLRLEMTDAVRTFQLRYFSIQVLDRIDWSGHPSRLKRHPQSTGIPSASTS